MGIIAKGMLLCCCRSNGCAPAFLAYGHHPLSTVLHTAIPFWQQIDRTSTSTMYGMLSQHGVQAHVNGHLHSAFGQRVHMLHKTKAGGMRLLLCFAAMCCGRCLSHTSVLQFCTIYCSAALRCTTLEPLHKSPVWLAGMCCPTQDKPSNRTCSLCPAALGNTLVRYPVLQSCCCVLSFNMYTKPSQHE